MAILSIQLILPSSQAWLNLSIPVLLSNPHGRIKGKNKRGHP
jgi:hypothetical protein